MGYKRVKWIVRRAVVGGEDRSAGGYSGDLTLLGVTKTVNLQFTFNKRARHPYTLKDTIGFSAVTQLQRAEFGMQATPNTIGDAVSVRIALEAVRQSALRRAAGKR